MKYAVLTAAVAFSATALAETIPPTSNVADAPVYNAPAPVPTAAANTQLYLMIEQLQNEVQLLRGLVEEQAYELRMLKQQGRERYRDLDARLLDLTKRAASAEKVTPAEESVRAEGGDVQPVGSEATPVSTGADVPSDDQKRSYEAARSLIKEKRYDEAVAALHQFIQQYPNSELTGNAYYWMGEVYLVMPQLEQARQAFSIVVTSFPEHRKAADSLFKLAVTMGRLGNNKEAAQYYDAVIERFPSSSAAKLAAEYKQKL